MRVLIAGAGIAGLAAAIALGRSGHEVEVLERSDFPGEVGAGLAIWPNGGRALAALGLDVPAGHSLRRLELRSWRGRLLSDPPVGELAARYGYPLTMVHRAELHRALLDSAEGANVRYATEVDGFDQQESRVRVGLRSGETREADLLVGADGIRSAVRRGLLRDGEPSHSGATCWRGVTGFDLDPGTAINWWGRGAEFGVFPPSGGRVYWFAVQNRPAGEADSSRGRKGDVGEAFASWPSPIGAVVEATEERAILRNDLYDRPPARSWSAGRVTLIGDAAHPMLPNAAQGACQALEDAVALGSAVAAKSPEDSLATYQARRIRSANRLVTQAHQTARLVQSTNPILGAGRNGRLRSAPRSLYLRQMDSLMDAGRRRLG